MTVKGIQFDKDETIGPTNCTVCNEPFDPEQWEVREHKQNINEVLFDCPNKCHGVIHYKYVESDEEVVIEGSD